jgi:hypothetical protein
MRRSLAVLIAIGGFFSEIPGNPVDPYTFPFISEFQMTDSTHWNIELGGSGVFLTDVPGPATLPCSTSILSLRIKSTNQSYRTKIFFDSSRIAVLSRASITGIPSSQLVVIHAYDTIMVQDTADTSQGEAWEFQVKPTKPGNSLVNFWDGLPSVSYETTRPSIGTAGNYTTINNVILTDNNGNPLPHVYVYDETYNEDIGAPEVNFIGTIFNSLIIDPISLFNGGDWRGFSYDSLTKDIGLGYSQGSFPGTSWHGYYIDTLFSVQDTIRIPLTSISQSQKIQPSFTGVRFAVLQQSSHKVSFVISSSQMVTGATINIYSISGKLLSAINNFSSIGPGTHTITWDGIGTNKRIPPAGTYICKLMVSGKIAASRKFAIR